MLKLESASKFAGTDEEARYNRFVDAVKENWPLLAGGGACLVAGAVLLFVDVSDFGVLNRIHHYFLGILLIIGGALILGFALAKVVIKLFGAG
jgi:hypothetical protein